GNEIALGVSMANSWPISKVCREAERRCQSRPLANEEHDHLRIERLANVVKDSDSAISDNKRLPESPTLRFGLFFQNRKQTRNLDGNSGCRQTVADHDLQSSFWRTLANYMLAPGFLQPAAKVGPHEIFSLAGSLAADFEQLPALDKLST